MHTPPSALSWAKPKQNTVGYDFIATLFFVWAQEIVFLGVSPTVCNNHSKFMIKEMRLFRLGISSFWR